MGLQERGADEADDDAEDCRTDRCGDYCPRLLCLAHEPSMQGRARRRGSLPTGSRYSRASEPQARLARPAYKPLSVKRDRAFLYRCVARE